MMLMAMRGIKECIRVRLSRRLHSFSSYRLLLVLFKYPAAVQVQDFFLLFFVVFGATVCKRWKMLKSLRSPLLMMINVFSSAFSSSFTFAALVVVRRGWDSVFIERSSVDNFLLKFFLSLSFRFYLFLIRSTLFYWSFIYYLFYPFFHFFDEDFVGFYRFFPSSEERKSTSATPPIPIQSWELDDQIIKSSPERRAGIRVWFIHKRESLHYQKANRQTRR